MDAKKVVIMQKIKQFRKIILWVSIGFFGISALIGIGAILFGGNTVVGQIISTTSILGLLTLLSANNLTRIEDNQGPVRIMSIIALFSNLVWSLIWIALVWGIFEKIACTPETSSFSSYTYYNCNRSYYDFLGVLWRVVAFSGIVSFTCTMISNLLQGKVKTSPITVTRCLAIPALCILSGFFILEILTDFKIKVDEVGAKILTVLFVVFVASSIICLILIGIQRRKNKKEQQKAQVPQVDEAKLRAQIEAEVRAKIAQEQTQNQEQKQEQEQTETTNNQ